MYVYIDSVNVDFVLVGCICNLFCVVNNMLDEKGCLSAFEIIFGFFLYFMLLRLLIVLRLRYAPFPCIGPLSLIFLIFVYIFVCFITKRHKIRPALYLLVIYVFIFVLILCFMYYMSVVIIYCFRA